MKPSNRQGAGAAGSAAPRGAAVHIFLWLGIWGACAAPANDRFADRSVLRGLPVQASGSNRAATLEPLDPPAVTALAGNTIWWSWQAPATQRVSVTTAGSDFDTVLAVLTGDPVPSWAPIAFNDDENLLAGIFTSQLTFLARAGSQYEIVVGGLRAGGEQVASGRVQLAIQPARLTPAPQWSATDVDGRRVQSSDYEGRVVLLDFWATWCAPCLAEIPSFIELQRRYSAAGFSVVGVSVDTLAPSAVGAFAQRAGINYPIVMTDPQLERDFGGVPSIPTAFLIDRDGNLIDRLIGFHDQAAWENLFLPWLEPADPAPALGIAFEAGRLTITWPSWAAAYQLQSAGDLTRIRWEAWQGGVETVGPFSRATLPPTAPVQFFRLRKP